MRSGPGSAARPFIATAVVSALALLVFVLPLRREFVMATSQEFANYGDLAVHILEGQGALTGLGQPVDLRYLRDLTGAGPRPPWPTVFRPLAPAYLDALAMRMLGRTDAAVLFAPALGYVLLVAFTVVLGERFFRRGAGVAAALILIASRSFLHNAYNAYPDCLFAAVILLLFLFHLTFAERRPLLAALMVGVCGGLAQLSRVNFVTWIPVLGVFLAATARPRTRTATLAVFALGLLVGGAPEWLYAGRHFGTLVRGNVGLENLANVQYEETWLHYVVLDPLAVVRTHAPALLRTLVANAAWLAWMCLTGGEGGKGVAALGRRLVAGALFAAGIVLAARGTGAPRLRRLLVLALSMLLVQIALFSVMRAGLRYFFWFAPLFWLFALTAAGGLAEGAARRWRLGAARPAWIYRGVIAATAGVAALQIGATLLGTRPAYADAHGFGAGELERIRRTQLPVLRALAAPGAVVISDRAFVLWYLPDVVHVPLPLDPANLGEIARDYAAPDLVYLTGRFFRAGDDADYASYTRVYLSDGAGRVLDGAEARERAVRQRFPSLAVAHRFDDGGLVLVRPADAAAGPDAGGHRGGPHPGGAG